MKKILYILGGLFALAVVAIVILMFSLGTIVKAGVNRVGPTLTQSSVVLQDASISPFSGAGTLKGLTVGNPPGWETPRAFFLKEITIQIELRSLTTDHIVIDRLLIDQPEITYETKLTTSNLQDLLKNIQQAAAQPQAEPQPGAKPARQVKIEIKSFRFQNGTIVISGAGKNLTVPMPDLALENLGTSEGGLTSTQLSLVIAREISVQVTKAVVTSAAKNSLIDKASESLRSLLGGRK